MAEADIRDKIQVALNKGGYITEPEVRSLMILVRKNLESFDDAEKLNFLKLTLFCNWCAHVEITQSMTGLRILSRANDALVRVKDSTDATQIRAEISGAIGFENFRTELLAFLERIGVKSKLNKDVEWVSFLHHLLEIIRDVPLAFPPYSKLKKGSLKIYQEIAQNPIKDGAGITRAVISKIDYEALGVKGAGKLWCVVLRSEDTTSMVVPLLIVLN